MEIYGFEIEDYLGEVKGERNLNFISGSMYFIKMVVVNSIKRDINFKIGE